MSKVKDQSLRERVNQIANDMQNDIMLGDYIAKRPYPSKFKNFSNLYKISVTDYFRLIYSIIGTSNKKIYLILDFLNHDDYNKLFGYKKS